MTQAPQTIDPRREEEVVRWAEAFGVKPEEVREAIRLVGPKLEDVRRKLAENRSY